jgi:hypothetical protein
MNPNESRKYYETSDKKRRASMDQMGKSPTSPKASFGMFGSSSSTTVHPSEHQAMLQQQYHERRMSSGSATAKK